MIARSRIADAAKIDSSYSPSGANVNLHLIHGSLGLRESTSQTGWIEVHPFLHKLTCASNTHTTLRQGISRNKPQNATNLLRSECRDLSWGLSATFLSDPPGVRLAAAPSAEALPQHIQHILHTVNSAYLLHYFCNTNVNVGQQNEEGYAYHDGHALSVLN